MNTTLPPSWLGAVKPSLTVVEDELENRIKEIERDIQGIRKIPSTRQPTHGIRRLRQLHELIENAKQVRSHAEVSSWPDIAEKLKQFQEELRQWRSVILSFVGGEAQANARAHFADAGAWANHFSIVRMTVSTFFITAAWTVVSLKWDEYSPPLLSAALSIWLLAGFFLWFFTKATYDRSKKQKEWQDVLPAWRPGKSQSRDEPDWLAKTWEWIRKLVRCKERPNIDVSPKTRRNIWGPFWIYLIVTPFYFWLLCSWAHHEPPKKKPLDQLAATVANIEVTLNSIADCLPCDDDDDDIEDWIGRNYQISPGPTGVTRAPTPTPTPIVTPKPTAGENSGCQCRPECHRSPKSKTKPRTTASP